MIGCWLMATFAWAADSRPEDGAPRFRDDFRALRKECDARLNSAYKKMEGALEAAIAKDDSREEERLKASLANASDAIFLPAVPKAFEIVKPHAAEPAAAEPLVWIVQHGGKTQTASDATALLTQHHLTRQPTLELTKSRQHSADTWVEPMLRAQLASVALPEDQRPKQTLALARRLQDAAEMQQGEAAKSKAARLEGEAVKLFDELREKYPLSEYGYGFTIGDIAKSSLFEIKNLGVGKTAPDIQEEDLDGETFKLSDYRGKTVLLTFWASWCGPCMALVPRERELVERYKGRPFALVGVNSDPDKKQLRSALEAHPVPWRSFWCGEKGPLGPIPRSWNVNSWPTVYLIDHAGMIRAKHLDFKALPAMIEELVAEAERAAKTD